MSRLRTYFCGTFILVAIWSVAASSGPLPSNSENPTYMFATCSGRLSALMEHQWMFDGAKSEKTKELAMATVDLLNAVVAPADASKAMGWRIEAKFAQRDLLSLSTFSRDPSAARRAAELSDDMLRPCMAILLGQ